MPSAPSGETAFGFQSDSAWICAASSGAEMPGHNEPASSSTPMREGMGTAAEARIGAADGWRVPPRTRAHSTVVITLSALVVTIRCPERSSRKELGRETTFGPRNLKSLNKSHNTRGPGPVPSMSPPRNHSHRTQAMVSRIDAVSHACRPMADFLFKEALGADPSEFVLRSAKEALMPLRGHPGRIGWAVTTLLEGGDSRAAYDDAVNIVLRAARGTENIPFAIRHNHSRGQTLIQSVASSKGPPDGQLVLRGFE